MKRWIPIPGGVTGRLAESGQKLFEAHGFAAVNVQTIADDAGVTTGALYHHFGSKKGLYNLIRDDLEKRIVDRMDAAVNVVQRNHPREILHVAIMVAFDSAVKLQSSRILSEPGPGDRADLVCAYLNKLMMREEPFIPGAADLVAGALKTALTLLASGQLSADEARCALLWMVQGKTE